MAEQIKDKAWNDYTKSLERLDRLVEEQAIQLEDRNWDGAFSMFGEMENARISAELNWQNLMSVFEKEQMEGRRVSFIEKSRAAGLLKKILSRKSENERMIQEEMETVRKGIVQLRETGKNHKSYLDEKGSHNGVALDFRG